MKRENDAKRTGQASATYDVVYSVGEIDFFGLLNIVIRRWKIVAFVATITCILVVATSIITVPVPVFQAHASMTLPLESDLKGLQKYERARYTPKKVFAALIQNMNKRSVRFRYFNDKKLIEKLGKVRGLSAERIFEEKFNTMLSIETGENNANVSFRGADAALAAEVLNDFVLFANENTIHGLIKEENSRRDMMVRKIKNDIENLRINLANTRKQVKRQREDQVIRLEEAARIAERVGLRDIITKSHITPNLGNLPLYMRGSTALHAEAAILEDRKSDDPFSTPIRGLQAKIERLQSRLESMNSNSTKIEFNQADFQNDWTFQLINRVTASQRPINQPRYEKVVLIGVLGGIVLGVLFAYLANIIFRVREKVASPAEH